VLALSNAYHAPSLLHQRLRSFEADLCSLGTLVVLRLSPRGETRALAGREGGCVSSREFQLPLSSLRARYLDSEAQRLRSFGALGMMVIALLASFFVSPLGERRELSRAERGAACRVVGFSSLRSQYLVLGTWTQNPLCFVASLLASLPQAGETNLAEGSQLASLAASEPWG